MRDKNPLNITDVKIQFRYEFIALVLELPGTLNGNSLPARPLTTILNKALKRKLFLKKKEKRKIPFVICVR